MKDLFFKILDMSVTASWVILAVMAVRFLLRKAPKKYSYALWVAALFRLLCPVSIQSVVSAFNFVPFHKATLQTTGELQFVPSDVRMVEINTGIPVVDAVINTGTPVVDTAVSAPVPVAPPVVTPAVTVTPMQMLVFVGMIAWVIGMMTMVTISIVNYIKLRKDLRFAVRMRENIWQCETVRSPFLVGLIKPKIYLPYGLDEQTQGYILAHEQYHLKRLDHIAKLLGYAALTIHWFNPLCHLAFRLMNSDMEMSCDEYVLDRNNIPTTQYSYSLLTIATNRRFPAATPLAFAESGVKERMINVLKWKKPKKWVSVVAVMVCTILLISCATNPKVTIPTGDDPAVDTTAATNPVEDELKVGDPSMLELPGMKWGATPEEVKAVLDLPDENYLVDAQLAQTRWLTVVGDFNFFGEEVAYGRFHYTRHLSTQDWALSSVELYYKEDTDMAAVKEELIALYGAPNEGLGFTRYRIYKGEIEEYVDPGFTSNFVDVDEPVFGWWQSETKRAGVLSEEIVDRMVASAIVDTSGLGTGLDPADPASQDVILDYLNKESATLLCCSNNKVSKNVMLPQYTTPYAVYFDATTSIWAQSYFELNQVGYNYVDDKTMLEFPRLKWGASVEEVKTALNIQAEQISTDRFSEGSTFDTHYLHVKDITFFGEEVPIACFEFRSVDEENLGLSYIMLFLDEDTDMEHLQAELSYQYQNEGTGETFDTCKWEIKDEVNFDPDADRRVEYELVEGKSRGGDAELWYLADNPPSGSGFKLYLAVRKIIEDPEFKTYNWVSPVKLTEVISPEDQNALKEVYEQNLGIDPATTEEYLAKRPTVWMSISNRSLQVARAEMEGATDGELALCTNNVVYIDAQTLIELQYEAQRLQKVLESE